MVAWIARSGGKRRERGVRRHGMTHGGGGAGGRHRPRTGGGGRASGTGAEQGREASTSGPARRVGPSYREREALAHGPAWEERKRAGPKKNSGLSELFKYFEIHLNRFDQKIVFWCSKKSE
jgi:hypothetical protein